MTLKVVEKTATGTVGDYRIVKAFQAKNGVLTALATHMGTDSPSVIRAQYGPSGVPGIVSRGPEFAKQRFLAEVPILQRISHPNVIRCLESKPDDEIPHFTLQWIRPGKTSYGWLRERQEALTKRELSRMGPVLCGTLSAVHEAGVVHRNVSPLNIVMQDENPLLIDFTYACTPENDPFAELAAETFASGTYYGTRGFVAPEMFTGDCLGTIQSDLWSLGSTLYFMYAGTMPYDLLNEAQQRHVLELFPERPEPDRANELMDRDVYAVFLKALAQNPADRYQSASEMAAAFAALSP